MGMVKTRNQQRPEMKKSEGVMKPQKTAKKMILPTVHFPRPNSLDLASCLSPLERLPGRPSKLSLENQLLLTLMYWREYRTQFHIAKSYGIHEANANRIIRKVESALAASGAFSLPGKRAAHSDEGVELSFVIVDVTETPVEKPKRYGARIRSAPVR